MQAVVHCNSRAAYLLSGRAYYFSVLSGFKCIITLFLGSLWLSFSFSQFSSSISNATTAQHTGISCSYVCLVGFSCHKWHTLFLTLLNLKSWGLEVSTSATLTFKMPYKTKVKTLWEDHTIWKNLPHVLSFTKERQNVGHFVKCLCPLKKTRILPVLHDH